jgi:hypothetical protein
MSTSAIHRVPPPAPVKCTDILRAARLIMAPSGGVHELRVVEAGRYRTISGYFDNPEQLAEAATTLDGRYPAVYVTLNPCAPELIARAVNRTKEYVKQTTGDADIVRRYWVPLDFDPIRKSGISSTDYEHGRAISVACGTWDELRTVGWGDPIVASSGNGAHLLYRCDLPNTPEVTAAIKRTLELISRRCSTDDVSVDTSVFNASRIWKIWGTMSMKGDSTPTRPHRRSEIYEVPDGPMVLVNPEMAL